MTEPTFKEAGPGGGTAKANSLYIMLVLTAAFAGYLYTVRSDGIFSCPGAGIERRVSSTAL